MDHEAALDEIFGEVEGAGDAGGGPSISGELNPAGSTTSSVPPLAEEVDVFDELERELVQGDAAASVPASARPAVLSAATSAPTSSVVDELDALLVDGPQRGAEAETETVRPTVAVVARVDATAVVVGGARPAAGLVAPARARVLSSPLDLASASAELALPTALAPSLSPSVPWSGEHLDKLTRALAASPVDAPTIASLCLHHRSIPPRQRAGVWTTLLCAVAPPAPPPTPAVIEEGSRGGADVTDEGSGAGGAREGGGVGEHVRGRHTPLSPQPKHTKFRVDPAAVLERIKGDLGRYTAWPTTGGGAAAASPPLPPPSLPLDAMARVVQSFCTTRMVPYSPALSALAAPLCWVTPDASSAFLLLYSLTQTFLPAYFSLSLEGWARVSSSTASKTGSASASGEEGGGDAALDTSFMLSVPSEVSERMGAALHACVLYHEPELGTAMDAACPTWWLTSGGGTPHGAGAGAPVGDVSWSAGAVPPSWFGSLFSACPGVKPTAVLPLWDRLVLTTYALQRDKGGAGSGTHGLAAAAGGGTLSMDVHAWPMTPAGAAVIGLAASLVLKESVSLRVVCRTAGVGREREGASGGGGTGTLSVKDRVKAQEAAGAKEGKEGGAASGSLPSAAPSQARALMSSALEGALKRMLKPAAASALALADDKAGAPSSKKGGRRDKAEEREGGERGGSGESNVDGEDEFLAPTFSWLASASTLLSTTPQSFGVAVGVDAGPPGGLLSPTTCAGTIRVSPAEVLPQVVYGWQRILAAVGAVPPSVRAAVLQAGARATLLPTPALPIRPVHVLVVDVRPASHRRAGRLATAYHIDAGSVHVRVTPALAGGKAAVEAVENDAAGASGVSILGSPSGASTHSSGGLASDGSAPALTAVQSEGIETAAWGVRGMPLATAIAELTPLNGKLHFVVCGVGARVIRGAYPPTSLRACAELDDARVAAVVRAMTGAGLRWVSVLEGGFGGIHGGVRNKAMHAPPLLPALRPDGSYTSALSLGVSPAPSTLTTANAAAAAALASPSTTPTSPGKPSGGSASSAPPPSPSPVGGDVYDISLFVAADEALTSLKACLVDHTPKACPACRHAAVARLFEKTLALAAAQAAQAPSGGAASIFPLLSGGAPAAGGASSAAAPSGTAAGGAFSALGGMGDFARVTAGLLDGLADSAVAAVQSLRDDLGVTPVTLLIPTITVPTLPEDAEGHEWSTLGSSSEGSGEAGGWGVGAGGGTASSSAVLPPTLSAATDAALSSILSAVRAGGVTARAGLVALAQDIAVAADKAKGNIAGVADSAKARLGGQMGGAGGEEGLAALPSLPPVGTRARRRSAPQDGLRSPGSDAFSIGHGEEEEEEGEEGAGFPTSTAAGGVASRPRGGRSDADRAGLADGELGVGHDGEREEVGHEEEEEGEFGEYEEAGGAPHRQSSSARRLQAAKQMRDAAAEKAKAQAAWAREHAREQATVAKEQAGRAREQAMAAASTARSVLSKALAPPPASNPNAVLHLPTAPASAAPQVQSSLAAMGRTLKAVAAPPLPGSAPGSGVPASSQGGGAAPPQPAPAAPSTSLGGLMGLKLGSGFSAGLAGGFAGLSGKAAEGFKHVASAAEKGVAMAQSKAASVAGAGAGAAAAAAPAQRPAPAPASAPVVDLPVMDALSARLLAGTAKGEEFHTDAPGLLVWTCHKEKDGTGKEAVGDAPSLDARLLPRVLVLAPTAGRLLVLDPSSGGGGGAVSATWRGSGVVKSNHHVTELGKLSYSRKKPNRITLWYRRTRPEGADSAAGPGSVELVPRSYVLEGAVSRPDGSLIPSGEAFATAVQATVVKVKSGQ